MLYMKISDSGTGFNRNGLLLVDRSGKGNSLLCKPDEYVVIDLETTGLSPEYDTIIELAALKVSGNAIIDTFSSLVRYEHELHIDDFITSLTGITQEMVDSAPMINTVLPSFLDFVGESIVVGHNVAFDINFIYDESMARYGKPFTNDYVDTMRISRRLRPELRHHRLKDVADFYSLDYSSAHRALADCDITFKCYELLCQDVEGVGGFSAPIFMRKHGVKASDITTENTEFDQSHPLYQKTCVFTGKLDKMTRAEAMQLVVDLGGINGDGVTKKTNYLILGNNDYCTTIKDGKSSKQKKAEQLIRAGQDLEILPESIFYEMVFDET